VLMVTHDPRIMDIADRVAYLEDGVLKESTISCKVSETERGANLVPGGLYLRLPGRIDHKHNERAPGWGGCHLRRRPIGSSKFPCESNQRFGSFAGTGMPVSRSRILNISRVVRSPAEMM